MKRQLSVLLFYRKAGADKEGMSKKYIRTSQTIKCITHELLRILEFLCLKSWVVS
jgi:hypothetical protein